MSDTEKRPYAQVLTVANAVADALRPCCHRLEIAGSLRRKKAMVGDIEIVAIPKLHTDLLGEPLATSEVDDLLSRWASINNISLNKNGPKYKSFGFEWQEGWVFHVDLFLQPDPATWGYNFMVRTGSAEFSKKMVTPKAYGGHKPDGFEIRDARVWRNGKPLETPEEADIFRLWNMDFVPPEQR